MTEQDTTVVKIGGALVADDEAVDQLWKSIAELRTTRRVVVVHGGGPRATDVARELGHEPRVVHGRRVTTARDLEIVQWTMRGELNLRLVARAHAHGIAAAGISGADGAVLRVVKRPPWTIEGESVDFGWVGDVQRVEPALVDHLLDGGFVPIVAPIGIDAEGQLYNVNADTVSCVLAASVGASEYILVTESGGVRRNAVDASSHMTACSRSDFQRGKSDGWIAGGMLVKLKVAFDALDAGIPDVYIVSPEGILDRRHGTQIVDQHHA